MKCNSGALLALEPCASCAFRACEQIVMRCMCSVCECTVYTPRRFVDDESCGFRSEMKQAGLVFLRLKPSPPVHGPFSKINGWNSRSVTCCQFGTFRNQRFVILCELWATSLLELVAFFYV